MWYEEWFDHPEYELVYQDRDEDEAKRMVDLLERIVRPAPGASILDMGCGRGRHARALARRGYHVTGVDLSAYAIKEAARRAAQEALTVLFRRGDMRNPVCDCCFDGVINVFTAFGYFENDADHVRALRAMHRSLCPGGWFVQDFFNVPYVLENLVPEDRFERAGSIIRQQRWVENGRVNKRITIRAGASEQTFVESVRLYTLEDFRAMYASAGLRLRHTYGDYEGHPYSNASPRLILHAEKPETDTC